MKTLEETMEKTKKFLLRHLKESNADNENINYYYEHSLRVANIAQVLAEKVKANKKIVSLASLLHDLAVFDVEDELEHGRESAKIARPFLNNLNLNDNDVEDICYAIAYHVDGNSGYSYIHTLEASVVSDADCIDAFGVSSAYKFISDIKNYPKAEKIKKLQEHKKKLESFKRLCIAITAQVDFVRPLETKAGCSWFKEQLELQISIYARLIEEYLVF